jgi:hypothetical protein
VQLHRGRRRPLPSPFRTLPNLSFLHVAGAFVSISNHLPEWGFTSSTNCRNPEYRSRPDHSFQWTQIPHANLTSATAVRTRFAIDFPFYCMTAEDSNAWYRMSGGGVKFAYLDASLTKYRVPSYVRGSQDRQRVGSEYPLGKLISEFSGFFAAAAISIARGEISTLEAGQLEADFLLRLARTLHAEGALSLAQQILSRKSHTPG